MCLYKNGMESGINNNNKSSFDQYTSPPSSGRSSSPQIRSPAPLTPPSRVVSPPPSLVPSSAMSMVSMASMLGGAHVLSNSGVPFGFPPGYPHPRAEDFNPHKFMDRGGFGGGESPPPPTVPTNDPSANECKIVEYRGEKIAAFTINGKTMLCLPQAFELFLKHLVGGLHTVYTKLKRLEITPVVCNVEQVRILRGLGAIQPGVNRCKLLGDSEFDSLYKDCTTSSSRPGRPPKRGVPFPSMSPQDAMLHLKNSMHNGTDIYKEAPYTKEPRLDKPGFGNGFGPPSAPPGLNTAMAAQFMALNHPAAFLSQGIPPFPGLPVSSSPNIASSASSPGSNLRPGDATALMKNPGLSSLEALQRSGLLGAAYFERMREGQKSLQDQQDEVRKARESSFDSVGKDGGGGGGSESPILNLSSKSGNNNNDVSSDISNGSDGGRYDDEDIMSDDESEKKDRKLEEKDVAEDKVNINNNNNNNGRDSDSGISNPISALSLAGLQSLASVDRSAGEAGQLNSVYGLIGNIQALLKVAVENAKQEERQLLSQKSELKTELMKEKESQSLLYKELQELKRNTAVYMRRFKKEKKFRRRLQEQLQQETKRRVKMEDALRATSAETLKRITESLQKEMQEKQKEENRDSPDEDDDSDTNSQREEQRSGNEQKFEHQYQVAAAAAAAAAAASDTSERSSSSPQAHRDTPAIGFAKNLFPFNGSSLFTSAN